jgi:hypothetical protein
MKKHQIKKRKNIKTNLKKQKKINKEKEVEKHNFFSIVVYF